MQTLDGWLALRSILDTGGRPIVQLELAEYDGLTLTHRTVGDGIVRWSYRRDRNEFRAVRYGSYQGALPLTYRESLFGNVVEASRTATTSLARLAQDVFGGEAAVFRPWLPGASVRLISTGMTAGDTVFLERSYAATPVRWYVQFAYQAHTPRTIVFELERSSETAEFELRRVFFHENLTSPTPRRTEWIIAIDPMPTLAPERFRFVPPANARPIVDARDGS